MIRSRQLLASRWGAAAALTAVLCAADTTSGQTATRKESRGSGAGKAYRVIAHPQAPVSTVARSFVADAFLKKTVLWPNGVVIRPVDLRADSPVRRRFVEDLLGRTVAAVRNYWQQIIFAGRGVPPPELDSDAAVVDFVISNPGAIGYVSDGANVGTVKVLIVK
jgi:hypothetical protein